MSALPPILKGRRSWQLTKLIAFALGQAGAAGLIAFATRDVFATFRSGEDAPLVALAMIVSAAIGIAMLRYGERVIAERLGQDYAASLRLAIFQHLSKVPARKLAERRVGHLSMRFVGDLSAVRNWITLGLARLVSAAIVLPGTLAVLFLLDADLAIAAALPLAVGVGVMALIGLRFAGAHRRLRSRRAKLAADMTERVVHAPELRLLGRMEIERRHLNSRTQSMVRSTIVRARAIAFLRAVPDVLSGVVIAVVFFTAFQRDVSAAVAAGAVAAIALAVQQLRDLAGVWDRGRAYATARHKCQVLLATPTLPRPAIASCGRWADGPLELRFEGVSAPGLDLVDATACAGRKIAVIGANGAGKSTLLALAAGLEQCSSGKVTIAGRDVAELSNSERRRMIAYLSNRSPILAGSLRRALTMGAPERPADLAIETCVESFGLGPMLERLGGLDGIVAEAGRNLSSGEVRRVLLARVAISRPRLMLLDEPDDALDTTARALVEELVVRSETTALVVTHQLDLARKLDECWAMDRGRLVATGRPEDVLSAGGTTARPF